MTLFAVRCRPKSHRSADRCRRQAAGRACARSASRTAVGAAWRIRSEGGRSRRAAARGTRVRREPRARCWPGARRRKSRRRAPSAPGRHDRRHWSHAVAAWTTRRTTRLAEGVSPEAWRRRPWRVSMVPPRDPEITPRPGMPNSANARQAGATNPQDRQEDPRKLRRSGRLEGRGAPTSRATPRRTCAQAGRDRAVPALLGQLGVRIGLQHPGRASQVPGPSWMLRQPREWVRRIKTGPEESRGPAAKLPGRARDVLLLPLNQVRPHPRCAGGRANLPDGQARGRQRGRGPR